MKYLKTINRPTKALIALLLPCLYLVILNKSLALTLFLSFGMTAKEYNSSYLILVFNILAGLFFVYETLLFLYSKRNRTNEF